MNVKMKRLLNILKDQSLINLDFDKQLLGLLWECCQIPDFVKKHMAITMK